MSVKQANKSHKIQKVLIIQTAYIGDVILATSLIESIHRYYTEIRIDFLLRKGNELLLEANPHVSELLIWDKSKGNKYKGLVRIIKKIRKNKYDLVVNIQRYFSTGLFTAFSGARLKAGFRKNPLSFFYDIRIDHNFDENSNIHEIERNHQLISFLSQENPAKPHLYFSNETLHFIRKYQKIPYVCIAPASVWFTKQFPADKWVKLIDHIKREIHVYLIGSSADLGLCETIREQTRHIRTEVLAGSFNLAQTAAIISKAEVVFVNDSAPLHMASATNAPTCAVFCSTVPAFGFRPLSDKSVIVEYSEPLACRPCGFHGKTHCPETHFKCAKGISINQIKELVNNHVGEVFTR